MVLALQEHPVYHGLNLRDPINRMEARFSPNLWNCDLSAGTLRERDGIYPAQHNAGITSLIDHLEVLHNDRGRDILWWQGGNIYADEGPRSYVSAFTGTQIDSALTQDTYPKKWKNPATTTPAFRRHIWSTVLNGMVYMSDGAGTPLRWRGRDQTGALTQVEKWGISPPKTFSDVFGSPFTDNLLYVQGGAVGAELFTGPARFAFTFVNKNVIPVVESNPSPIVWNGDPNHFGGPWPSNGVVGQVRFYLQPPTDPQITHVRVYKSTGSGRTLFRWDEIPVDRLSPYFEFAADGSRADHRARYNDVRLSTMPTLQFDHDPPPKIRGCFTFKDVIYGWQNFDPLWARPTSPVTATCVTAVAPPTLPLAGWVVWGLGTPWTEDLTGCTIRFPQGTNRRYVIVDVDERPSAVGGQRIRLGVLPGLDPATEYFESLDPLDRGRSVCVIEGEHAVLRWSKRGYGDYWPKTNFQTVNQDDGEDISSGFSVSNRVVVTKPNSTHLFQFRNVPSDGELVQISDEIGTASDHGFVVRDDAAELYHYTGVFRTDGVNITRISGLLRTYFENIAASSLHCVHNRIKGQTWLFSSLGDFAFVHNYRHVVGIEDTEGPWGRYKWERDSTTSRLVTASISAADQDGIERVWLGDGYGRIWMVKDQHEAAGNADGRANAIGTGFKQRSMATAAGSAANRLVDASNVFPDAAASQGSVLGDPVLILGGAGAGQKGYVSARISATELEVTGLSVPLDATSEYVIGWIDVLYEFPWEAYSVGKQEQVRVHAEWEPKVFGTSGISEPWADEKRFYLAIRSSFKPIANSVSVFELDELRAIRKGWGEMDVDPLTKIAMVHHNAASGRLEVNYATSVRQGKPNPGHVYVELGGFSRWIQNVVGVQDSRIKLEIIGVAPEISDAGAVDAGQ